MAGFSKIRHVSFSSKMKSQAKRSVKKAINPYYGTKAAGSLHPIRRTKSNAYRATTINTRQLLTGTKNSSSSKTRKNQGAAAEPRTYKTAADYTVHDLRGAHRFVNPAWWILLLFALACLTVAPWLSALIVAAFIFWFRRSPRVIVWTADCKLRWASHQEWRNHKAGHDQMPPHPDEDTDDLQF